MIFSKSKSLIDKNSDFLAYTLIDTAVDRFYPILDEIENSVSDIEDLVLEKPDRKVMNRMTDTRTKLLFLRKSAWLIREVLSSLERGSSAFIASKTIIYLRDVYDHIAQIMDLVETYRDILASSRDTYMSSVSNSLNEIMKQLTIISTIMLPLTFIVGVYGMNFKYFPELEWRYGYFAVWAVIIILVITMIAYFKIKKWI
jgi:magnesium transporter